MKSDWVTAAEAARLLVARGIDPSEAISAMIRESGLFGLRRVWHLASGAVLRTKSGNGWLLEPEIDIARGTLVIATYANGRRMPEWRPEPLLLSLHEIDRRWPSSVRGKGGRPLSYDREAFQDALRLEIEARGFPSAENDKGWRTKADVERWTADFLDDRQERIGPTQVKQLVSVTLETLRSEVGN